MRSIQHHFPVIFEVFLKIIDTRTVSTICCRKKYNLPLGGLVSVGTHVIGLLVMNFVLALLTYSSDSDPEREAHVIFYGDDPKNHLSRRSAPVVGDFDEDGKADVILAAPDSQELYFFSDAGALSGKVNTSSADATITGDGPAYFGLSMDVGDVDGDGEDDLLVGAPDYTDVSWYAGQYADEPGRVYLFTGDPTDYAFGSEADAQFTGRATGDLLGASVALGDISGDGLDDILVASPNEGTSSTSYPTEGYLWILEAP